MFCSVYSVSLCCSVYCLCVNVYSTTATLCQTNCILQIYISYHLPHIISCMFQNQLGTSKHRTVECIIITIIIHLPRRVWWRSLVPVNRKTVLLSPASSQSPSASKPQPSILECRLFSFLPPHTCPLCRYVRPAQLDSLPLVDTWMNMEWVGKLQSDYIVGVIIVIIGLLELPLSHGSLILRPSTAHYQTDISHPPQWPYMSNTNKEIWRRHLSQRWLISKFRTPRHSHTAKNSPRNGQFYSFYVGVALEIGWCEKQIAAWNIRVGNTGWLTDCQSTR